jgi:hypothetical protein
MMLWHASAEPQRLKPRGGRPCPDFGGTYLRAIDEQLNPTGRWRE